MGKALGAKGRKNTFFNALSPEKMAFFSLYFVCFDWRMLKTVWACVEWYSAINHKFSLVGKALGAKGKEKTLFLMQFHPKMACFSLYFVCFDWRMLKTVWACVEWYSAINHKFSSEWAKLWEQKGKEKTLFLMQFHAENGLFQFIFRVFWLENVENSVGLCRMIFCNKPQV